MILSSPYFQGSKSIFTLFLGLFSLISLFHSPVNTQKTRMILSIDQSILSKNQFDLTVSKSERFLLSLSLPLQVLTGKTKLNIRYPVNTPYSSSFTVRLKIHYPDLTSFTDVLSCKDYFFFFSFSSISSFSSLSPSLFSLLFHI